MANGEDANDRLQPMKHFEQWLQEENAKLSKILAVKVSTSEDLQTRHNKLKVSFTPRPINVMLLYMWVRMLQKTS